MYRKRRQEQIVENAQTHMPISGFEVQIFHFNLRSSFSFRFLKNMEVPSHVHAMDEYGIQGCGDSSR